MKVIRKPHFISGFTYTDRGKLPAITHCGEGSYVGPHRTPIHCHFGFEFVYLSRGTLTRLEGAHETAQRMGDVYIAYPYELHRVDCRPDEKGHQLWIGLLLDQLGAEGLALSSYLKRHQPRLLRDCQSIEPILQGIIRQVITSLPQRREAIRAYLHALCVLLRQAAQRDDAAPSPKLKAAWPFSPTIQKTIYHMEKTLDRRLALPELAAQVGAATASRLCSQFHHEVKMTPAAYHLQLRLAAAREALLQPQSSVTKVAMDHGFSSAQHFCAAFRRAFNITATEWRGRSKRPTDATPSKP